MGSTHTSGAIRAIPSGFLNRLGKITSRKPSFNSEVVDKIYPNHAKSFRKAGLASPILPTIEELGKNQDEKMYIENKKEPDVNKRKTQMSTFVLHTHYNFFISIHRVIKNPKNLLISLE